MLLLCWEQKLSSDQKTCLFSLCRGVYCPPIWGDITNHSKDPYWPTTTRQYNEILEGFGTLLASEKKTNPLCPHASPHSRLASYLLFVCLWSVGYAAGQEEHNGTNMKSIGSTSCWLTHMVSDSQIFEHLSTFLPTCKRKTQQSKNWQIKGFSLVSLGRWQRHLALCGLDLPTPSRLQSRTYYPSVPFSGDGHRPKDEHFKLSGKTGPWVAG